MSADHPTHKELVVLIVCMGSLIASLSCFIEHPVVKVTAACSGALICLCATVHLVKMKRCQTGTAAKRKQTSQPAAPADR